MYSRCIVSAVSEEPNNRTNGKREKERKSIDG
jgi:hypothetical protein